MNPARTICGLARICAAAPTALACAALPACYGERPWRILPVAEGREAAG